MIPDFGQAAEDYAAHRAGFPPEFFERVLAFGVGLPDQRIVDVGTGTGALARVFAANGARVIGLDKSELMLEQARRLAALHGIDVDWRCALAEETGLPDASADVVSAGQCWHWLDRPRAMREALRILRPAGTLLIAHFDWLPLSGNVVEATEALILAFNPQWQQWSLDGGTGMYPQWLRELADAGFHGIETFSFDIDVPYSGTSWRARMRASSGVGASLPPERVAEFDGALADLLARKFPTETLTPPHRVFAVIAIAPG